MRRLIKRLFCSYESNQKWAVPSLPSDFMFSNLIEMSKRGFLARKIALYMENNPIDADYLYFLSFTRKSFIGEEEGIYQFLSLGEWLLKWNDQQLNIPQQIQSLNLKTDLQNALLKVYEMYKYELFDQHETIVQENERKKEENERWEIYRDVLYAASQKKLLLISEEELSHHRKGQVICEYTIERRSDIPIARTKAKECLEQKGYDAISITSWLLIISEAITNVVKHAEKGKMTLLEDAENDEIRVVVEDNGPGFALEDLPNTTLLAGYSTKKSLGQGFTLMMKIAKQILLCNTGQGAVIILIFPKRPEGRLK